MVKKSGLPIIRVTQLVRPDSGGPSSPGLTVSELGRGMLEPLERPGRLAGGTVALCSAGEARISVNLKSYDVRPNDLVVLFAGSIVQIARCSDDFSMRAAGFSSDFIKGVPQSVLPLYPYMFQNPVLTLSPGQTAVLAPYFGLLREKSLRRDHLYTREIALQLLLALFFEISALYQARHPKDNRRLTRNEEIFKRLMQLIMRHYRDERGTGFYARELCLTPKYLSSVVKKISNRSVSEWIAEAVILDAKTQLRSSQMTVQQIANYLNFPNPSFFGRFFKKHTGMTPKAFRESE